MIRRPDYVKKKYAPFLDKTLENAIASRIANEFPRIGGPRIQQLCAEMILEIVDEHVRARETMRAWQMLWPAISVDDPPSRGKATRNTRLVPVVLDMITADDIEAILVRRPRSEILTSRCVRLCRQAFEQGALLSGCDLVLMLGASETAVAHALTTYERRTASVVPRRATVHDVGTGMTHKRVICLKRHLDGKPADQVALETCHSLEAVDRYLGDYDRVRHCRQQGLSIHDTAFAMQKSVNLVSQYLAIDDEIEAARSAAPQPVLESAQPVGG
ncbi:MAG: DUF1670 domain-containing protein [Thermoanaerobaculia bacterium]